MNPVEVPASPRTQTIPQSNSDGPAVTLHELTKLFGRFAALRAVTAEFAPGFLYALLGDNGAGKSTLLRIMAGLAQPTRGSLRVLGVSRPREAALSLGYMGHAPLLYDDMTGMENLLYFAGLYGVTDEQTCADAIAGVGLDPALKRRVGQYSQGMRQRLSLARAVVHDPRLLLLDEPFSNVDAASAAHMVKLLASMRDQGKTIFVITHQPALLAGAADESVFMAAGQIVLRAPGIQTSLAESPR